VDSRGHGNSGLGAPQLTYRQIADDMIQLMSAMSIEEVSVIGWSDGGIVGLLMAIKSPNIIRKMALMAPNTRPASQSFYQEFVEILENQLEIVQGMIQKNDQSQDWLLARQHLLMMLKQPNISSQELKTITAPVLIIAGDKDGVTNKHIVELFEGLLHGHLAIMPGETHFMPMSNPDLFNSLTSDFLFSQYERPDSISIIKEHLGI
jgi:pimeloyl-ACP methyl ester carboxylesterase